MRDNMNKVLERDSKLGDLEDKAGMNTLQFLRNLAWICLIVLCNGCSPKIKDGLREGANRFEKKAVKLKRKMQWKNLKVSL